MSEATPTVAQEFDWECNFCGQKEGVISGICPKCGPTQTTPLSLAAKKEAGMWVEPEAEQPNDNQEAEQTTEAGATEK